MKRNTLRHSTPHLPHIQPPPSTVRSNSISTSPLSSFQPLHLQVMSVPSQAAPRHIYTAHSDFLLPPKTPSHPPSSLLLRGVNLSSKFPSTSSSSREQQDPQSTRAERDEARRHASGVQSHMDDAEGGLWSEAEKGGKDGWFVGHPLALDGAEVS
jgi:hypothetical protein